MWEYYYEGDDDQRDEDEDGHGNTVAAGLVTVDAMIITHVSPRPFWLKRQCWTVRRQDDQAGRRVALPTVRVTT
jgi:hypothetical protein